MAASAPTSFKSKPLPHIPFSLPNRAIGASFLVLPPRRRFVCLSLCRACSDGGAVEANTQSDTDVLGSSSGSSGTAYVGLFVRMLGIDNDPLDREQAITALWKYSQGGKQCIDAIMQFPGCVNLTINLLNTGSPDACMAAAGLLRTLSSVSMYRDAVAGSGAIEEISSLIARSNLNAEVKEQSLCTLWNLSVDKNLGMKIANLDLLPLLVKFLDDEEIKVKEAAGGVIANLALIRQTHGIMVEAGVIQKLAEFLRSDDEDASKVLRKEAKSILLELAADEYYRILIVEEGLVLVPLIGAAAYKSFKPASHTWPSLPDGTELKRRSQTQSRYGASELLLGLNIEDRNANLDEAKMNAIVGRTNQQFIARIGAIELEGRELAFDTSSNQPCTLLPWIDGVARLVLILGLDNELALERAANSIADAAINEHMRTSFKEAGALKYLVQLLDHEKKSIRLAVAHAMERLSMSNDVCKRMEAEGVVSPLVNILKRSGMSEILMEKAINILARLLDTGKGITTRLHDGSVNGSGMVNGEGNLSVGIEKFVTPTQDLPKRKYLRESVFDSPAISRLMEILKSSSANLQTKAALILEHLACFEEHIEDFAAAGVESAIDSVFQQICNNGWNEDVDNLSEPELVATEEAGSKISSTSRLLVKLLSLEQFRKSVNHIHFILVLRKLLRCNIPLHAKEWVAACLVKLEALAGSPVDSQSTINREVVLYETIPRLVEQLKTSFSPEAQETAVIELNEIVSKGYVDCTRAVASQGAIFPLVKLIEQGTGRALEASLAILYNLSMDSENHSAIIAAGAVTALRRIVMSQNTQWPRALHLLRTLPT